MTGTEVTVVANGITQRSLQWVGAMRSGFNSRKHNQRGTTLIECLVVMAIITIISASLIYLLVDLLGTPAVAMQKGNQNFAIQQTSQAITAPLSTAAADAVGTKEAGGAINPTSMAGDQLIFTASDGGCYRFWYDAADQEILEIEDNNGCSAIDAARGPNEAAPADCIPPDEMPAPCDQILDGLAPHTWVVARNVVTDPNGGTGSKRIFTYYDYNHQALPTDEQAQSGGDEQAGTGKYNLLYADAMITTVNVGSIQINYWQASPGMAQDAVAPIEYRQTVTLQLPADQS